MNCINCGGSIEKIDGVLKCSNCGTKPSDGHSSVPSYSSDESAVDVVDDNIQSVVEIYWGREKHIFAGSGFAVSEEGDIITNRHVVEEDGIIEKVVLIKLNGEIHDGLVVRCSNRVDLAHIKIAVPTKPVKLGSSDLVKNGMDVVVIGNSKGSGTCTTKGIVSDKLRKVKGKNLVMYDAAINDGNSGGPIFNKNGEVIAVVVSGVDGAEGMNFGVPVDEVKLFF